MRAIRRIGLALLTIGLSTAAHAAPITQSGDPFTLVATQSGAVQLFGLAADTTGNIYIGNNSNNSTGIPVQEFNRSLYLGVPIAFQNFGPNVGDADGMAFSNGFLYVADA